MALCPPRRRLVVQNAVRSPAPTAAAPESEQTRGVPQTSGMGTLSLLESCDQWRVVQRAGCWPRWDLELADPVLARLSLPREHLEVWGHRITAALLLGTEARERQSPAMGWVLVGLTSALLGVVALFVLRLRRC
jgi:hypothetical protein